MLKVISLSELHIDADFDFQKSNDDTFSVLHWQCKGDFSLGEDDTLCVSSESLNQEAYDFVCLAKQTAAFLVLTPEYSFPWEYLDRILADQALQPDQGKLWCLCMQYLPIRAFEDWLEINRYTLPYNLQRDSEQIIICDKLKIRKQFVNMLAYVFKNTDGKLVVLLQSKIAHMRDTEFQFEASNLSLGDTIYLFDNVQHDIRAFCSMICADALESDFYESVRQKLPDRKHLVFHPQLNPEPNFAGIMSYINVYINQQWSFLRLNWAPYTKLLSTPLQKPGTGYIYKADQNIEAYWNSPNDQRPSSAYEYEFTC